ncbi:protein FAM183B [Alligator sinensis]|uniref:Protein FAM183B n=1 Tax=Alligator sinensis TaxID=38654 RepID=A0A1U7S1H2_ALLSI|nr:protein FAM183B [Alligator sinensis]
MALRGADKEAVDAVHRDQIFRETVQKELRCQHLHTHFSLNPQCRIHTFTRKPMSWHDNVEEPVDTEFLNLIHHATLEPSKKYSEPQTESQEIGWNSTPLISMDRSDRRLYFPRRKTEITKHMEAIWSLKEQSGNTKGGSAT